MALLPIHNVEPSRWSLLEQRSSQARVESVLTSS
jgi:hypothetical protein